MKKTVLILLLIFIWSCTSKTIYKKPADLIPKKQMINLLTDLYLANGARSVENIDYKREPNYIPLVFEKYHIDSARFKRSNIYYTSKLDEYQEMFQKVLDNLNKKGKVLLIKRKKKKETKKNN